jgi:polyisoprenyl-phosphate glycosyltransferase
MSAPEVVDNQLIVLMPVYNDWDALGRLLPALALELSANSLRAAILLVDDGSTVPPPKNLGDENYTSIESIDILHLRRNSGHQRAIGVGLCYIEANRPCHQQKIIFAMRIRRSENLAFRFFYNLYRLIHLLLTGIPVRVGNFSAVPMSSMKHLAAVSELWIHYAAAVHKAKLPIATIPTQRSPRLAGLSRMDPVALVVHGLSAMAIFGDRIGVRLLILVSCEIVLAMAGLAIAVGARLFTNTLVIPDWAFYDIVVLFVMLIQMLLLLLVFAFVILALRDRAMVIPSRDYVHITDGLQRVYGQTS